MKVKNALTRKFGPLPAWAWFLLLGAAYYFYRKNSAVASGTGTGSVAPAPTTPQPQSVLQPGESLYDPNSGALVTAPGGNSATNGGTTAADLTSAMDNLAAAIATGTPAQQVDVTTTPTASNTPTSKNKKRGKPKGHAKDVHLGTQSRSRSAASVRATTGGRTRGKSKPGSTMSHRMTSAPKGQQPSRTRQRPRNPAVTKVTNQRRVATMPRQSPTRQTGGVAPRPSAPPPRTQRSPSRPPAHRRQTGRH